MGFNSGIYQLRCSLERQPGKPNPHCVARPQQFLPSKQLKYHKPGRGLELPTKRMQGQRATTVPARRPTSTAALARVQLQSASHVPRARACLAILTAQLVPHIGCHQTCCFPPRAALSEMASVALESSRLVSCYHTRTIAVL